MAPKDCGHDQPVPVARLALGWRAREVERRSTARMAFPDDDLSSEGLEDDPVSLAYADPEHAFVLPPGRFVRADQAAGRSGRRTRRVKRG